MKKVPEKELKKGVDYIGITCVSFCHDGKANLLLHKRSQKCRDERGNWDVGGGSLEFGESFEEGVRREVREEYCTEILDLKYLGAHNVLRANDENKKTHWIALFFVAKVDPEKVKIGEPDYMDDIGWFSEKNLPEPIHTNFYNVFDLIKKEVFNAD